MRTNYSGLMDCPETSKSRVTHKRSNSPLSTLRSEIDWGSVTHADKNNSRTTCPEKPPRSRAGSPL